MPKTSDMGTFSSCTTLNGTHELVGVQWCTLLLLSCFGCDRPPPTLVSQGPGRRHTQHARYSTFSAHTAV